MDISMSLSLSHALIITLPSIDLIPDSQLVIDSFNLLELLLSDLNLPLWLGYLK